MLFELRAPANGYILPLEKVSDPVFSQKVLGEGFAIEPFTNILYAPVEGRVKSVAKTNHAITIETATGYDVLVHFGLETVALSGEGITPLVKVGDEVTFESKILEFDLLTVPTKVKSLLTPVIISEYSDQAFPNVTEEKVDSRKTIVKLNLDCKVDDIDSTSSIRNSRNVYVNKTVRITNGHGIHARPAAMISHFAKKYDHNIVLIKGEQKVSANSIVGIMGLAIQCNDEVTISATGSNAQQVIDELIELISSLEDEEQAQEIKRAPSQLKDVQGIISGNQYHGISVVKGLAIGELSCQRAIDFKFDEYSQKTSQQEESVLKDAIVKYKHQLHVLKQHETDATQIALLDAHIELVEDELICSKALEALQRGKSAAFAWHAATQKAMEVLINTNNELLQERVADIKDVYKQVMLLLLGQSKQSITYDKPTILYSDDFSLSDILSLDNNVVGLISTNGGRTSHVAIIAGNKNIPYLININSQIQQYNHQELILDANQGSAITQATPVQKEDYHKKIEEQKIKLQKVLQDVTLPATTLDGKTIDCYMNIKSDNDCKSFIESGAQGIGLFRTEFVFYDRDKAPSEDEQYQIYQRVLDQVQGSPVIFRTLDAGGDKALGYLHMTKEQNPFLGIRGIRLCFHHEALFRTQLRAIIRTNNPNVHIMLPMITNIAEYRQAKEIYQQECQKLGSKIKQPLGIMVEVPSIIMQAEKFASEVDFMSIGTNDLTQYLLAIDREHPQLASQIDHLHPAVIQAIKVVSQAAKKYDKKLSICGMMAVDQEALAILVGLGITNLSMRQNMLAENKAIIRKLNAKECQDALEHVLSMDSAQQVRDWVKTKGLV